MGSIGWRIILPRAGVALVVLGVVAGLIVLGNHREHEPNPGALATRAHFEVTGSARGRVAVEYGGDFLGPFSRDPSLPFTAVERIHRLDDAYTVTAKPHGTGRITCRVQIGDAVDTGRAPGRKRDCSATLEWYGGRRGPVGWYRPSQLGG